MHYLLLHKKKKKHSSVRSGPAAVVVKISFRPYSISPLLSSPNPHPASCAVLLNPV